MIHGELYEELFTLYGNATQNTAALDREYQEAYNLQCSPLNSNPKFVLIVKHSNYKFALNKKKVNTMGSAGTAITCLN